jgi:ADP-heptose:LPS heptosyltransferase
VTFRSSLGATLHALRDILWSALDRFVCLLQPTPQKDCLVLVRLDAIGDFILWLPFAYAYRKLYPKQRIVLIANSTWADFAEEFDYWDEVWPVHLQSFVRNPLYRWRFLSKVAAGGFSAAIQPTYSRVFLHGDSIVRATRAFTRIGYEGDYSNIGFYQKKISDRWYTRLVPANHEPMMELTRNEEFVRGLCMGSSAPRKPIMVSSARTHHSHFPCKPYAIIFPGASWAGKMWPVDNFAELAQWLHKELGYQIVVCGSQEESSLAEALIAAARLSDTGNYAGKTTLSEFVELVSRADLLVGNDTSAVHIAAAVGTPSICLLGGGHYGRFMPYPKDWPGCRPFPVFYSMECYGCNWQCDKRRSASGSVPCVENISLDAVKTAICTLRDVGALSNVSSC